MCAVARTQCGDDVPQGTQTLIDRLCFFEAIFIVCRTTRRKSFRSSQVLHTLISSALRRGKGKARRRTTRFKQPSHASFVILFTPLTRNVKTECDREERSFIKVVATARRDCARWRSEATWPGLVSGTAYHIIKMCRSRKGGGYVLVTTSVIVVRPLLSCLISCLRLSSSPVPSRSLIVSLYCYRPRNSQLEADARRQRGAYNFHKLPFHRIIPSLGPGVLRCLKYLLDCAGDHPHCRRRLTTLHGPRLPTPRLTIREDRAVVPIRDALYKLADVLEHLALARAGLEYAIEGEQRGVHALSTRSRG